MRITREEKLRLKEKILNEALPSLKVSGPGGAPVDTIMKNVGLTSGALYSHFKSKDDFFNQVILRELDRVIAMYRNVISEHGSSGMVQIIEMYLKDSHLNDVAEGCVFAALGPDLHRQKPAVRAQFEEKIAIMYEVAAQGLKSGTKEERFEKVAFIFASMIGALVSARTIKSETTARSILQLTKRELLKYIKAL